MLPLIIKEKIFLNILNFAAWRPCVFALNFFRNPMNNQLVYIGKDLEAMSFAVNYHKWILKEFRVFLGKNIVEVGAGTGSFSELLLKENPASLALVEPSEMFEHLKKNLAQTETSTEISFYHSIFRDATDKIVEKHRPDTIIYINVLEHIEDDLLELQTIYKTLGKDGHCLIFVPALMGLYGEFDRKVGHFRRYSKKNLEAICKSVGFEIVRSKYFDLAGILPWFIKYKVLKSDNLSSGAVSIYDKIAVPVMKRFESLVDVPLGKNILMVVKKTED